MKGDKGMDIQYNFDTETIRPGQCLEMACGGEVEGKIRDNTEVLNLND